jgi:glyoxylase-like metal-dependent hydrolase (beta-lactamase superfamily II)
MQFIFEQVRTGGDRNFGYLIGDRQAGVGVLVDPAYAPGEMVERARAQGLRITHILNTHGHADHSGGNAEAKARTGALVAAYAGSPLRPDAPLKDGDRLKVGGYKLRVWHVPGHSEDHLAFLIEDKGAGLTGDHLFVGKIGGTSTERQARTEWDSLQRLLRDWPDALTIWPGHDYGARPASTIAWEKETNPFLLCRDFQAFLRLKEEWPEFKVKHGLR